MATNFPTSLDDFSNPTATSKRNAPSVAGQMTDKNDAIEALEAKVGIDSSAVTTSHDYKLSEVTSTDKAVGKSATQAISNKTFSSAPTPTSNDGAALGSGSLNWSDLFLASGALISFANGNVVITHSSGIVTLTTGDLRMTTSGTNAASVATVGGTQTLTGKTISGSDNTLSVLTSQLATRTAEIWYPASVFVTTGTGTPALGSGDGLGGYWLLDAGTAEGVGTSVLVPHDFVSGSFVVKLYWSKTDTNAGDIVMQTRNSNWRGSDSGNQAIANSATSTTITGDTTQNMRIHTIDFTQGTAVAGHMLLLSIRREGGDGSDTYGSDIRFYGVKLEYTART